MKLDKTKNMKIYKGLTYYSITCGSLIERTNKLFFTKIIDYKYFNIFGKEFRLVKNAIIPKKYYDEPFSDEAIDFLKSKGAVIKNIYFNDLFFEITEEEYLKEERSPTGFYNIDENKVKMYNKYFKYQCIIKDDINLGPIREALDIFMMGTIKCINYNSTEVNLLLIEKDSMQYYVAKTKYGFFECKLGDVVQFGDIGFNPKSIYDDLVSREYGWLNQMLSFLDANIIEFEKDNIKYRVNYDPKIYNTKFPEDLYKLTYNDTFTIFQKDACIGNKLKVPSEEYFKNSRGSYTIKTLGDSFWRAKEILKDLHS